MFLLKVNPVPQHHGSIEAKRGSEQYHSTNSVIAWSYVRWPLFEVSVLRTADLACSRSGKARTRFGVFLFFRDFDMDDGLLAVAFYDAVKSAQAVFVGQSKRDSAIYC